MERMPTRSIDSPKLDKLVNPLLSLRGIVCAFLRFDFTPINVIIVAFGAFVLTFTSIVFPVVLDAKNRCACVLQLTDAGHALGSRHCPSVPASRDGSASGDCAAFKQRCRRFLWLLSGCRGNFVTRNVKQNHSHSTRAHPLHNARNHDTRTMKHHNATTHETPQRTQHNTTTQAATNTMVVGAPLGGPGFGGEARVFSNIGVAQTEQVCFASWRCFVRWRMLGVVLLSGSVSLVCLFRWLVAFLGVFAVVWFELRGCV